MTRGFDANVPTRKPRPKISRVISELTSGAVAGAEDGKGLPAIEEALPTPDRLAGSQGNAGNDAGTERPAAAEPSSFAEPSPAAPPKRASRAGSSGRERI